jgi:hypothetical protein
VTPEETAENLPTIQRLEVREEDRLVLRAWYCSASKPALHGKPIENLATIPVQVTHGLDLAPATIRLVTDQGVFDTALGPPPELSRMFRRGDDWWLPLEDAGNLHALLEDALDAEIIEQARTSREAQDESAEWESVKSELGL